MDEGRLTRWLVACMHDIEAREIRLCDEITRAKLSGMKQAYASVLVRIDAANRAQAIRDANARFVKAMEDAAEDAANPEAPNPKDKPGATMTCERCGGEYSAAIGYCTCPGA